MIIISIARLVARILGMFLVGLVLIIAIGEGAGGFMEMQASDALMFVAFLVSLIGMLVLWKWEKLGGLLVIGGMLVFYGMNFIISGVFPGGWILPLCYVPGLLSLWCVWQDEYQENQTGGEEPS